MSQLPIRSLGRANGKQTKAAYSGSTKYILLSCLSTKTAEHGNALQLKRLEVVVVVVVVVAAYYRVLGAPSNQGNRTPICSMAVCNPKQIPSEELNVAFCFLNRLGHLHILYQMIGKKKILKCLMSCFFCTEFMK
jgi:hypothetical protein